MANDESGSGTVNRVILAIGRAYKVVAREIARQRAQRQREVMQAILKNARKKAAQERRSMFDEKTDRMEIPQKEQAAYDSRCADRAELCKKYVNRVIR